MSLDERTTDGRFEGHDDVIRLVEVLELREFAGILMREGSDLVGSKAYLLLKRICTKLCCVYSIVLSSELAC